MTKTPTPTRCGYAAILGAPNAGKSTLTNALAGGKVSIVTPKVQTTRFRVRGIVSEGSAQVVLVDTPGIFKTSRAFEREMVDEAWAGAGEADAIALLIDARKGLNEETSQIIESLKKYEKAPLCLILNKIDTIDKPALIALAEASAGFSHFQRIFMISALKNDGVKDVRKWLAAQMPEGPFLYPEDQLAEMPMRQLAAEITREKLFLRLNQELPYSLTVETEKWETRANGTAVISQVIRVERDGQKTIVIGSGGEVLKAVGTAARKDLEAQMGCKVHLELFVKVDPDWQSRGVNPPS